MQPSALQERLARVVKTVFGGNANAAATAANVEPSTLHRLLEGKVADPRINTVRKLADAFGVPTAWLLGVESTESAQGRQTSLPEAYWLLRSFHRRRQQADRDLLKRAAGGSTILVREAMANLDLLPASEGFPLESVSHLLREVQPDDPDRVQIERDFAELEGRLVAMAARLASPKRVQPDDGLQSSINAATVDED